MGTAHVTQSTWRGLQWGGERSQEGCHKLDAAPLAALHAQVAQVVLAGLTEAESAPGQQQSQQQQLQQPQQPPQPQQQQASPFANAAWGDQAQSAQGGETADPHQFTAFADTPAALAAFAETPATSGGLPQELNNRAEDDEAAEWAEQLGGTRGAEILAKLR